MEGHVDKAIGKVKRYQLPLLPAYAFTIDKCQGQTIPYSIIDIREVPNGGLTLAHLYVAFSRSEGHDNIRILRTFGEKTERLFKNHIGEGLRTDDKVLDLQARDTKREFMAGTLFELSNSPSYDHLYST